MSIKCKFYFQIVNAYMWLIGNTFDNVAIMDVFFYTDLAQKRSVNKWIKADTFSKEKVLIPALQANHWSLVVNKLNIFIIK